MTAVIRLHRLTKRFGRLEAVKEVTLEAGEGEFLTLLGPSGCGKTTTLRLISGFEISDEGEVYIGETLVNHLPPFRRDVNTVFQNYALFPHLTVFENVAYGLSIKRIPKAEIRRKVDAMLDRVALRDKAKSLPSELSGGQMQRIALARAIINEPRVLLLDEPLSNLDAKLRRAMQLELKHLQSTLGITFIYVTHDQEEALAMSDRIAVMDAGSVRQIGTPTEVFERPANRFVADFVGVGNFLGGEVATESEGRRRVRLRNGHSVVVADANGLTAGTRVTLAVRPQKIGVFLERPEGVSEDNVLPARLREVVYVGTLVRLVVALEDGQTLQVENMPENLRFDYRTVRPSQPIWISMPPDALLVYPS